MHILPREAGILPCSLLELMTRSSREFITFPNPSGMEPSNKLPTRWSVWRLVKLKSQWNITNDFNRLKERWRVSREDEEFVVEIDETRKLLSVRLCSAVDKVFEVLNWSWNYLEILMMSCYYKKGQGSQEKESMNGKEMTKQCYYD